MYDDFTYANNNILFISRKNLYILRYVALALKIHAQIFLYAKVLHAPLGRFYFTDAICEIKVLRLNQPTQIYGK